MPRHSKLPEGMKSQDDLQRVIDRLTAVLEDECGDNLGAWGAVTMVLLTIICDIAHADIQEVADSLKKHTERQVAMTNEDIIRMYTQVSDELCDGKEWCWQGVGEPLQRFAKLVAAAEREACAKVCDEQDHNGVMIAADCAFAIRERGAP